MLPPATSIDSYEELNSPGKSESSVSYQPSYCLTDGCPLSGGDGGDSAGLVEQLLPGFLAGIENVVVAFEHPVGEIGLAQVLPDVFGRIELRTCRRQRHHCEVFRHLEFGRSVPAGFVDNEHGVGAGATFSLISSRCLRIAAVLAYGMMMAAPVSR